MADTPCHLLSLGLAGFRAYLREKTFDFRKKRNLAIFGPNGDGKSSVIDALEFMFSKEGTLERLGLRTINNQAGFAALAHHLADESEILPNVTISVIKGKDVQNGERSATGPKRPIPAVATELVGCFVVSPIIRGHALRSFVEEHTPEQRYMDVATWLQLGPLVEVQKNLRVLRLQVKAAAEDLLPSQRIDIRVAKETAQVVKSWDAVTVLAHVNASVLAPLDTKLALTALAVNDSAYVELESQAKAEENRVGLAGLRQIRNAAVALWTETTEIETGELFINGAIPVFEAAVAALSAAVQKEAEERDKAAHAAFETLWKAAESVFSEDATVPARCPVCTTPIDETKAGSIDAIRTHVSRHLEELADYAAAKKTLNEANTVAILAQAQLAAALPVLIGLLSDDDAALKAEIIAYQGFIAGWPGGDVQTSDNIVAEIAKLLIYLDQVIADIETKQGDHTYVKAKAKIDHLLELQAEHDLVLRTQEELANLSGALTAQATMISCEIRKKVQVLLDKLQTPMNDIYKLIQGAGVPIRLELPPEDDTNQQRLNLVIDFAKNRTGVQPGGYLSDSQIHSVALALRLAAIKLFNAAAPIIALDDIVTSYDADHRRTIAGLIAALFRDCQILITTHDERFFNYLKDQLEGKTWAFTRIIGLDPTYGPRFADHKVSDEMIEERWAEGESAANEMRQAEEEWLLGICRDFGVSVRIRPLERAYSYERSELASALASFLKATKLEPACIPGVNNRFLNSLQKGEIENFGSHFQDAPYGDGSIGDEKARWEEFKKFRSQFCCKKCNKSKFQRPMPLTKPVCARVGCEVQFEFAGAPMGDA